MAPNDTNVETQLKLLIKALTPFRESDKNFQLCLQFASSNIKHHRFLDVDESRVKLSYERICEKLVLHSQQEKAEYLQRNMTEYLRLSVSPNDTILFKSNVQYGILSLLLHLAHSPTKSILPAPEQIDAISDNSERFDWAAYLLDGESSFNDAETLSSDDEGEDTDLCAGREDVPQVSSDLTTVDVAVAIGIEDKQISCRGYSWLQQNTMIPYWLGALSSQTSDTQHRDCNLAVDWDAYLSQVNPIYVRQKTLCLTEYRVIREVLWALMGSEESTLFKWYDNQFKVNDLLEVTHLTSSALNNLLAEIAQYATMVRKLRHFLDRTVAGCLPADNSNNDRDNVSRVETTDGQVLTGVHIPLTYQAFAAQLAIRLQAHRQLLCAVERRVVAQEQTFTILQLLTELRPHFEELATLYYVYEQGVAPYLCVTCSNVERACRLLGTLYECLVNADTVGCKDTSKVDLLLSLWVHSCRPYVDIIDEWLTHGNLVDPSSEFIISRSSLKRTEDETFWNQTFTIQQVSSSTATATSLMTNDGAAETPDSETGVTSFAACISWMPQFLAPVTAQIMRAGKSLELLQSLGLLKLGDSSSDNLFAKFVNHINRCSLTQADNNEDSVLDANDNVASVKQDDTPRDVGVIHTSLTRQMTDLFANIDVSSSKSTKITMSNELSLLPFRGQLPVLEVLHQALYPPILARYESVCQQLMTVLRTRYHLSEKLADIRKFYLMEAGDVMHTFYSALFAKRQQQGDAWQDSGFLNIALQDAVHPVYPKQAKRLYASVATPGEQKVNTNAKLHLITSFENLVLHCKVNWPISMVLSARCMEIYNRIFGFLLQIKWAKHALEHLDFDDLHRYTEMRRQMVLKSQEHLPGIIHGCTSDEETGVEHSMHLIRSRMLYFANCLHSYVTFRILHTSGIEFSAELAAAHDLDEVLHLHNKYVVSLYERCFLQRKVHLLREVMLKALNLSLLFCQNWGADVVTMRMDSLKQLDTEFAACMQFLRSFLNNVTKRGSFPHLESLAASLETAR